MYFSLEVIRARKGDCLLVHFGSEEDRRLILIDGGPSNVYGPFLKPRLERLREERGLDESRAMRVDVLMVSHIDEDHIKGILDLARDLGALGGESIGPFVRVKDLWHNSLDVLLATTPEEIAPQASYGTAGLAQDAYVEDGAASRDALKVLASIPQAKDLQDAAKVLGWKINGRFGGKPIVATGKADPVPLDGGLALRIAGPMQAEIDALRKDYAKWQEKRKQKKAESALAAFVDESVPNLSSIVVLVEAEGKRMLLTGDARGDKIIEGLQMAGLLEAGRKSTMHVDIVKVPHHGSANNLAEEFFRRITADHYVFSGNGEYGNPERESLEMLHDARGSDFYTIHLTYPIEEIDVERKKDWEKEQAKEKARGKKKVRPDWSPAEHGLVSFFEGHRQLAKRTRIVQPDHPHLIDLLDELEPQ